MKSSFSPFRVIFFVLVMFVASSILAQTSNFASITITNTTQCLIWVYKTDGSPLVDPDLLARWPKASIPIEIGIGRQVILRTTEKAIVLEAHSIKHLGCVGSSPLVGQKTVPVEPGTTIKIEDGDFSPVKKS